jgi:hypothetical protein
MFVAKLNKDCISPKLLKVSLNKPRINEHMNKYIINVPWASRPDLDFWQREGTFLFVSTFRPCPGAPRTNECCFPEDKAIGA